MTDRVIRTAARAIEAGQLAREHLASPRYAVDATIDELQEIIVIGDRAFDHFVTANLPLAISLARPHLKRVPPAHAPDIVQAAFLGLIQAVQCFDVEKGYKFSTYGTWWIRKAINDELLARRDVRIGPRLALQNRQIRKFESEWEIDHLRPPTDEEIAENLGLRFSQVEYTRRVARSALRLNQPVTDDGRVEFGAMLPDPLSADLDARLIADGRRAVVQDAMTTLSDNECDWVARRFGFRAFDPKTVRQCATELGLSVRAAADLEAASLEKLRRAMRDVAVEDVL